MDSVCCSFIESVLQRVTLRPLRRLQNLLKGAWSELASHHSLRRVKALTILLGDDDDWCLVLTGPSLMYRLDNAPFIVQHLRFTRIRQVNVLSIPTGADFSTTKVDVKLAKKLNKFMKPFVPAVEQVYVSIDRRTNVLILDQMDFLLQLRPNEIYIADPYERKSFELLAYFSNTCRWRYKDEKKFLVLQTRFNEYTFWFYQCYPAESFQAERIRRLKEIIKSTTDLHSPQVRNKMTKEEKRDLLAEEIKELKKKTKKLKALVLSYEERLKTHEETMKSLRQEVAELKKTLANSKDVFDKFKEGTDKLYDSVE
uniref:Coiled-coil domain-containing protein n=1 Tax=Steinernema glaseri TaxID=37863 RepID=A0A1I7ZR25_9BILA